MAASIRLRTRSADETRALGRSLAMHLDVGDVVSLTGDLGAGKTTLVQGFAAGLDVRGPVVSPTFTLVREYQGRFPIHHLDIYRLDRVQDVIDLGFEEMVDGGAVVFVEWGDAIETLLPESHLQVELELSGDGDAEGEGERRSVTVSAFGPGWAPRWERLVEHTRRWAV
jgi:tRNA threonylcarbamoyladenosine biosynthesis protein TsaE